MSAKSFDVCFGQHTAVVCNAPAPTAPALAPVCKLSPSGCPLFASAHCTLSRNLLQLSDCHQIRLYSARAAHRSAQPRDHVPPARVLRAGACLPRLPQGRARRSVAFGRQQLYGPGIPQAGMGLFLGLRPNLKKCITDVDQDYGGCQTLEMPASRGCRSSCRTCVAVLLVNSTLS